MAIASITALLNNLELLGFDKKKDCKDISIDFNVNLFTSSQDNVEAFQFISYFLFKSIDDQKTSFEFQSVWPIESVQQSVDFMDICIHLLNEYKRQNQYFESIQIKKSLLVDCSEEYIIQILLALSKIALDKVAADWEREENDNSISDNAEEKHSHREVETSSKQEIPLVDSSNNKKPVDVEGHTTEEKETSTPKESHLETKDDRGKRESSRLERSRLRRREEIKQIKQWGITPPGKRFSVESNSTLESEQSNLNIESSKMGSKEKLFEKNHALGESGKELVTPVRKSKPAEEKIPKGSLEGNSKERLKKLTEREIETYSNVSNLLQHTFATLRTEVAKYKGQEERRLLREQEIRLIKEHGLSNIKANRENQMEQQHLEREKKEKERIEHEKKEKERMEREAEVTAQKEKEDAIIREESRLLEAETSIKQLSNKKADVLEKTLDPSDHLEIDRREVKRLKNEADEKLKANRTELERLEREQIGLNDRSLKKNQAEQKRLKEEQTTLLERARIRGLHEECLELGYSLRKQLAVLEREEVKVLEKENVEREKLQKEVVAGTQSTSEEEESVESESQTKDDRDYICRQQVKAENVEDTKEYQQQLLQSSEWIEKENAQSSLSSSAKKFHKLPYEKLSHPSEFRYKILQILSRPVEEVEEFNLFTLSQSVSKNVAVNNDFTNSQESIDPPLRPFSGIIKESPKRSFGQVDRKVKLEPSPKRLK